MDHILINNNVITIDNAVGIGLLEHDEVKCPYEIVSAFTLRTALLDNICSYGKPYAITFSNGCGDIYFNDIMNGFNQVLAEAKLDCPIIGSTESNFKIVQSSMSVTIIGTKIEKPSKVETDVCYAVVGYPLVGPAVIANPHKAVPISDVLELVDIALDVIPIGSKGITGAMTRFTTNKIKCELDVNQSGGPSTSILVRYNKEDRDLILKYSSVGFHEVVIHD